MKSIFFVTVLLFIPYIKTLAANTCESYLSEVPIPKLMNKAKQNYDSGKFGSTIKILKLILKRDPDDLPALSLLSRSHLSLSHLDGALKFQQRIMILEKTYREASYFSLAQILIAKGLFDEADTYLDVVLKYNPKQPTALGLKAESLLNQKRLTEAHVYISEKGRLNPKDPYYLILEAQYNYLKRNFERALDFVDRLRALPDAKLRQKNATKAFRMGLLLKAKILSQIPGSENEALNYLVRYEQYSNFTSTWVQLLKAELYFNLNQINKSRDILIDILKYSSDLNLTALAQLLRMQMAGHQIPMSDFLREIFENLPQEKLQTLIQMAREPEWIISDPSKFNLSYGSLLSTQFWFGLRNLPITSKY